jgi:hypothetical protein
LPERQWEQFSETGILEIPGSQGTYRICVRDLTRILESQSRKERATACLQLTVPAPEHDRIIAEYMLIRNDEGLYWRTANIMDNKVFGVALAALADALLLVILIAEVCG